jgi:hypothetical protein
MRRFSIEMHLWVRSFGVAWAWVKMGQVTRPFPSRP